MRDLHVDTSALGRILLEEAGASAVAEVLSSSGARHPSRLPAVELRRVARRRARPSSLCDALLEGVALTPLDERLLTAAQHIHPGDVATLDAIHLATAVDLHAVGLVSHILTFDRRLAEAAVEHGLELATPTG